MLDVLILAVFGCLIGYGSYYFARAFDGWMDYGGIFYQLRLKKFYELCSKYQYIDLIEKAGMVGDHSEEGKIDFVAHMDYMNELFWTLADRVHSFKLWVCVECMSIRLVIWNGFVTVIGISIYLQSALYLLSLPLIIFCAVSTISRINA